MPSDAITKLIDGIDLEQLCATLGIKVSGPQNARVVLCQFHADTHPSMRLYQSPGARPHYHCFACGAHGDAIALIEKVQGVDFWNAVKHAAQFAGKPNLVAEQVRFGVRYDTDANSVFYKLCTEADELAPGDFEAYLVQRKIKRSTIQAADARYFDPNTFARAQLALAEAERRVLVEAGLGRITEGGGFVAAWDQPALVFPIRTPSGVLVGLAGRIINGLRGARWRFTRGTRKSETFFGADAVNDTLRRVAQGGSSGQDSVLEVWLVEGIFDALRIRQMGGSAVAVMGSGLSLRQAVLLEEWGKQALTANVRLVVHLFFDSDAAGKAAVRKAVPTLLEVAEKQSALRCDVVVPPPIEDRGKDPDELLAEEDGLALARRRCLSPLGAILALYVETDAVSIDAAWADVPAGVRDSALRALERTCAATGGVPRLVLARAGGLSCWADGNLLDQSSTTWGRAIRDYLWPAQQEEMPPPARRERSEPPTDEVVRGVMRAVAEARASMMRLEFPTDDGSWDRVQRHQVAWSRQIAWDLQVEAIFRRPHAGLWVAKDDGSMRLKAAPPIEDLIAQHYVLHKLLQSDTVPAVRWTAETRAGSRWRTTGPDRLRVTDAWGRGVHSFGYVVDDEVIHDRTPPGRSGIYRHYWSCYHRYLTHLETGLALLRAPRIWVRRLDVKSFYDVVPRRGLERVRDATKAAGYDAAPWPELGTEPWDWLFERSFGYSWHHPGTGEVQRGGRHGAPHVGVPQGPDLSAWLANICLFSTDVAAVTAAGGECVYARYVDDIILLGSSFDAVERVQGAVEAELGQLGMQLTVAKSEFGEALDPVGVAAWLRESRSSAEKLSQVDVPDLAPPAETLEYRLVDGMGSRTDALLLLHGSTFDEPPCGVASQNRWVIALEAALAAPDLKDRDRTIAAKWGWIWAVASGSSAAPADVAERFLSMWHRDRHEHVFESPAAALRLIAPAIEGLGRALRARAVFSQEIAEGEAHTRQWTDVLAKLAYTTLEGVMVLLLDRLGYNSGAHLGPDLAHMLAWRMLDVLWAAGSTSYRNIGDQDLERSRRSVLEHVEIAGVRKASPQSHTPTIAQAQMAVVETLVEEKLGSGEIAAFYSHEGGAYHALHRFGLELDTRIISVQQRLPRALSDLCRPMGFAREAESLLDALAPTAKMGESADYHAESARHLLATGAQPLAALSAFPHLIGQGLPEDGVLPLPPRNHEPALLYRDNSELHGCAFRVGTDLVDSTTDEDRHLHLQVAGTAVVPRRTGSDSDILCRYLYGDLLALQHPENRCTGSQFEAETAHRYVESLLDWARGHRASLEGMHLSAAHLVENADDHGPRPIGFMIDGHEITASTLVMVPGASRRLVPRELPRTNRWIWAIGTVLADYFGYDRKGREIGRTRLKLPDPIDMGQPADIRREILQSLFGILSGRRTASALLPDLNSVWPFAVARARKRLRQTVAAGDDPQALRYQLLLAEVEDRLESTLDRRADESPGQFADLLQRAALDAISGHARVLAGQLRVKQEDGEHRTTFAWRSLAGQVDSMARTAGGTEFNDEAADTGAALALGLAMSAVLTDLRHLTCEILAYAEPWLRALVGRAPDPEPLGMPNGVALISGADEDLAVQAERVIQLFLGAQSLDSISLGKTVAGTGAAEPQRGRQVAATPLDRSRELHAITVHGWAYLLRVAAGLSPELSAGYPLGFAGEPSDSGLKLDEARTVMNSNLAMLLDKLSALRSGGHVAALQSAYETCVDFLGRLRLLRASIGIRVSVVTNGSKEPRTDESRSGMMTLRGRDRDDPLPVWRAVMGILGQQRQACEMQETDGQAEWIWSEARRGGKLLSAGFLGANLAAVVNQVHDAAGSTDSATVAQAVYGGPEIRQVGPEIDSPAERSSAEPAPPTNFGMDTPPTDEPAEDQLATPEPTVAVAAGADGPCAPGDPPPPPGPSRSNIGDFTRTLGGLKALQERAWASRRKMPGKTEDSGSVQLGEQEQYLRVAFAQWDVDESYTHPLSEINGTVPVPRTPLWTRAESRRRAMIAELIRACKAFEVDLLVLPEYSTRPETVRWLLEQRLGFAIVAGTYRVPPGAELKAGGAPSPHAGTILNGGNWCAAVPYLYSNRTLGGSALHVRSKVFPAVSESINERFRPPTAVEISFPEASTRPTTACPENFFIELVCSELFLTTHPAVLSTAANQVARLWRDFGVPRPDASTLISALVGGVAAYTSRLQGRNRRTIQIVPAMTKRTADYQFAAMTAALASSLITVFCNSTKDAFGGGHSFVAGPRSWKSPKPPGGSPHGPYAGPQPGLLVNAGTEDKGGLGPNECAMVIVDIDPNTTADPRPTPQDWTMPIRFVAHLPFLKRPAAGKDHRTYTEVTWSGPGSASWSSAGNSEHRCRKLSDEIDEFLTELGGDETCTPRHARAKQLQSALRTSQERLQQALGEVARLAKDAMSSADLDHASREVAAVLDDIATQCAHSPGLRDREQAYKKLHRLEPRGSPPPALVDFLWVEDSRIEDATIWIPAVQDEDGE